MKRSVEVSPRRDFCRGAADWRKGGEKADAGCSLVLAERHALHALAEADCGLEDFRRLGV